jgi:hypothetical protein
MPDPVAIHSIILIVAAVAAMGEGGYSLFGTWGICACHFVTFAYGQVRAH